MKDSYASYDLLLHDLYMSGGKMSPHADGFNRFARMMLERATLIQNLLRAKTLLHIIEEWQPKERKHPFNVWSNHELAMLLNVDCYSVIVDDLILLSAFEIFAKSRLLRKGYIVHEIKLPKNLAKEQLERPIHVRSIRALSSKGIEVKFKESSVGISVIVKPDYIKHFSLSATARAGLNEVRKRRNLVHFSMGTSYSVNHNLLDFAEFLQSSIPRLKSYRPRSS